MEAGGCVEPVAGRLRPIARLREARTVAPEFVALTMLCLACLGGLRLVAVRVSGPEFASPFWVTLFALAAPLLFLVGGLLLGLSRRLTRIEKTVGIGIALFSPLSFALIRPYLAGWYKSCAGGSEEDANGKVINSYSYCVNGPNGVTHTVEWVWTLVPLAIALVLGTFAVHRTNRSWRQNPRVQVVAGG